VSSAYPLHAALPICRPRGSARPAMSEQACLVLTGFGATFVVGMMSAVGAVPVLALRSISPRGQTALLGFGAGVMLAATFFSLLVPALDLAGRTRGEVGAALI